MRDTNKYISIITLDVNALNTKRERSLEWIKEPDATLCYQQEASFSDFPSFG